MSLDPQAHLAIISIEIIQLGQKKEFAMSFDKPLIQEEINDALRRQAFWAKQASAK